MTQYITYDLITLEDIKMGTQGSQIDTEYALSYIAGSTIRGAYIRKYLNTYKNVDISKEKMHREKLLSGGMKFLNVYPLMNRKRSIPFPSCFYSKKEDIIRFNDEHSLDIVNEFEDEIGAEDKRVQLGEFSLFNEDTIQVTSVEKVFHLHINKRQKENNLYRYEAIKRGQVFSGIIVVEKEEYIDECVNLINNQIFYIGGSKGSGYGKCRIENINIHQNNPEQFALDSEYLEEEKSFYLYAASDMISRDRFGRVIGYVDEDFLREKLNLEEVEIKHSSMQTNVITGYNNKWNSRLPQIIGIKAGSIFKYNYKGKLDLEKIRALEKKGIGDRKEEGYGRIIFMDEIEVYELERHKKERDKVEEPTLTNQQDKEKLKNILTNIYKTVIGKERTQQVLALNKETYDRPLNKNQLGKLLEVTINIQTMHPDQGKTNYKNYLKHIFEKKNNSNVSNQLQDAKINNVKMYDYLLDYIEKLDDIKEYKRRNLLSRKNIQISGIEPEIDAQFVYKSNLKLLEEFFRYRLRLRREDRNDH